jgi:hypothetical protein
MAGIMDFFASLRLCEKFLPITDYRLPNTAFSMCPLRQFHPLKPLA